MDAHVITCCTDIYIQRNPTQVLKEPHLSSFFFLWNHGRTHQSHKVLSEGDGTSWETTFEQHSTALLMTDVQPPGTQSWTEQLRIKRGSLKLTCTPVPDPDKAASAMLSTIRLWFISVLKTKLCGCQAAWDRHPDAFSSSFFPCSCLQTLFLPMFFDRHFSLGDPWWEFWIGAFSTTEHSSEWPILGCGENVERWNQNWSWPRNWEIKVVSLDVSKENESVTTT